MLRDVDNKYEIFESYESLEREELENRLTKSVLTRHQGEESSNRRDQQSWHGTAFVLECVILMLFLTMSLAIITNLFGSAHTMGQTANDLTHALVLASTESVNGAEAFEANPTDESVPSVVYYEEENGVFTQVPQYLSGVYTVKRTVTKQAKERGILYSADIEVVRFDKTIYKLQTERYVSEGGM